MGESSSASLGDCDSADSPAAGEYFHSEAATCHPHSISRGAVYCAQ